MKLKQLRSITNEEILLADLAGRVAERLPFPKNAQPFYSAKARLVEAGNSVLKHIEDGNILLRKEVIKEGDKFKTSNYVRIIGGKEKKKLLTRGFETLPGVVHQKNVRSYRLRPDDKKVLQLLGTTLFHRSEFCTEELLKEIHALIEVDENSKELEWKREARYENYRKEILGLGSFYLSAKYDGRIRMYYEGASLEGFRPHGKAYESLAFEVEERELNREGYNLVEALHIGGDAPLIKLRTAQKAKALETSSTGMLVELDVTNSGLLIAGLSFHSEEMLKATNGYGEAERADSHTVFGNAYGLTRDEAKKIHTPLLHGASNKAIAKELEALTGDTYTAGDVAEGNERAYGKAVHNINEIAKYGRAIMSNERSEVSWIMPDGFRATHRAYTVRVPLELELKGRKLKMMKTMPLLLDGKGMPVYDKTTPGAKKPKGKNKGTHTKIMGLYANIIHSIDAYVMRKVIKTGIEILAKHDAFLVHPNDVEVVQRVLQQAYAEVFDTQPIQNILKQIEETTSIKSPSMFEGNAVNKMYESEMFLTVE